MKALTSQIKSALLLSLFGLLLTACGGQYEKMDGISYLAPLGNPPIDYIIWSPNNPDEILITASVLNEGHTEIYILNISTKEKDVLVKSDNGGVWAKSWLPDSEHIIVAVSPQNPGFKKGGYWVIGVNDNSRQFLSESGEPIWSPDGKTKIIYNINLKTNPDINEIKLQIVNATTNSNETIFTNSGTQKLYGLSWSPEGGRLAFSLGDNNSRNIFVMDLETLKLNQLTASERNSTPVWSPKGDFIAYTKISSDGLTSSLHLIKPDGSCDIEIQNLLDVRSPTWSPDGQKLAFVASDGIYYIELNKVFRETGDQAMCP